MELSAHVDQAEEDRLVELDIRGELLEEELFQIVATRLINHHVEELVQRLRAAICASQRDRTDLLLQDLLLDSLLHRVERKFELAARLQYIDAVHLELIHLDRGQLFLVLLIVLAADEKIWEIIIVTTIDFDDEPVHLYVVQDLYLPGAARYAKRHWKQTRVFELLPLGGGLFLVTGKLGNASLIVVVDTNGDDFQCVAVGDPKSNDSCASYTHLVRDSSTVHTDERLRRRLVKYCIVWLPIDNDIELQRAEVDAYLNIVRSLIILLVGEDNWLSGQLSRVPASI